MPPKKSKSSKKSASKSIEFHDMDDEQLEALDEKIEPIDKEPTDFVEERDDEDESTPMEDIHSKEFFTSTTYDEFTKKNNIELLSENTNLSNDQNIKRIVVPPELRITDQTMTISEYTRVIAERSLHIRNGAPEFKYSTHEEIEKRARDEIDAKQCPLSIERKIPPNFVEIWQVNEMIIPANVRNF